MSSGRPYSKARAHYGVTLIELMVSITIGMVIVLFVSTLYISSRSSARINDDNAIMQNEGRMALSLIGRNLMQAGFGNLASSDMTTNTSKAKLTDFIGDGLFGCNTGFATPNSITSKKCASTEGQPAFQVSYRVENTVNTKIGAGTDCNGQTAPYDESKVNRVAVNRFFLKKPEGETQQHLYCLGNGNNIAQPLLGNVDGMWVRYGITTQTDGDASGFKSVEKYVKASEVVDWGSVVSVNICLDLSSPTDKVTMQNQTYVPCGTTAATTAKDNRLHMAISSVYTLRNNASARNFSM